jgi:all-trans-retinol 13,14-reductase
VTAERFWSKHGGPSGPWDYVVIGSGMGGMTTAAMLAKMGKRVLVLEQHYVPGGFTHSFRRRGYEWDVGVHAVGEVTEHTMTGRLLTLLTDGRLEWASLGDVYDEFYFPDGFRIGFPDSPEKFREALVAAFPGEARGIDDYLDEVRDVARAMKTYYLARAVPKRFGPLLDHTIGRRAQKYLDLPTAEAIARFTADPRLQAVLTAQWGYYGSLPSRASFAMHALVVRHFLYGGYYPAGGAKEIARGLLSTVAAAGGWTRVRADVEEILIEGDRAVGVRLRGGEEIRAARVVSACGIQSTVMRLLPQRFRGEQWVREVEGLDPAPAHVCVYLGFKGDIRKTGAGSANKWFYETWVSERDIWSIYDPDADTPVLYVSFPSLKDPRHDPGPEQRHTGEIVTFVPWSMFGEWRDTEWKDRPQKYDELKQRVQQKLLAQFFRHMPELEPMLDYAELSTPVSTRHFVRPVMGSIYGLEPTPRRFRTAWLRPRAPIENLFFSGSEVTTVGVMGAMMGGVLAAASAEPAGTFTLLKDVARKKR